MRVDKMDADAFIYRAALKVTKGNPKEARKLADRWFQGRLQAEQAEKTIRQRRKS